MELNKNQNNITYDNKYLSHIYTSNAIVSDRYVSSINDIVAFGITSINDNMITAKTFERFYNSDDDITIKNDKGDFIIFKKYDDIGVYNALKLFIGYNLGLNMLPYKNIKYSGPYNDMAEQLSRDPADYRYDNGAISFIDTFGIDTVKYLYKFGDPTMQRKARGLSSSILLKQIEPTKENIDTNLLFGNHTVKDKLSTFCIINCINYPHDNVLCIKIYNDIGDEFFYILNKIYKIPGFERREIDIPLDYFDVLSENIKFISNDKSTFENMCILRFGNIDGIDLSKCDDIYSKSTLRTLFTMDKDEFIRYINIEGDEIVRLFSAKFPSMDMDISKYDTMNMTPSYISILINDMQELRCISKFNKIRSMTVLKLLSDYFINSMDTNCIDPKLFDYKIFNKFWKDVRLNVGIEHIITFSTCMGKSARQILNKNISISDLHDTICGVEATKFLEYPDLADFVVSNIGKLGNSTIYKIIYAWELDGFPKNGTVKQMKEFSEKASYDNEKEKVLDEYEILKDKKLECNIHRTVAKDGIMTARILDPNDPVQFSLGHITSCCQTLDGAAESSMIEGLLNPDSGFLVFEKGKKIIAQAWIWLSTDKQTLVLDNIEFANDRKIKCIEPVLLKWVNESPYQNIQMGLGYNKDMKIGEPYSSCDIGDYDNPNYNKDWFEDVATKLTAIEEIYTDADERVWVKKNGKDWRLLELDRLSMEHFADNALYYNRLGDIRDPFLLQLNVDEKPKSNFRNSKKIRKSIFTKIPYPLNYRYLYDKDSYELYCNGVSLSDICIVDIAKFLKKPPVSTTYYTMDWHVVSAPVETMTINVDVR